jgi:hypothetical protein
LYESEAIKSVDRSAPVSFPEICKMITSMFANVESSSKSIEDQLRQFKRSSKALKGAHFIETLDSLIHGYINQNNT